MPFNSDERTNLSHLVPALPSLSDDGFSMGVLARTRFFIWRYYVMHAVAWACLGLSLLSIVPWLSIVGVIQRFVETMIVQSIQQADLMEESLLANFDRQIEFSQPVLLVTAAMIVFTVAIAGLLAED